MGSGDIEVQVKARTLKHIKTDIIEKHIDKKTCNRDKKIQRVLASNLSALSSE